MQVCAYLFDLQAMAPDAFQEVAQTGDERVLLQAGDADLAMAQLRCLLAHLLHQHALSLVGERTAPY